MGCWLSVSPHSESFRNPKGAYPSNGRKLLFNAEVPFRGFRGNKKLLLSSSPDSYREEVRSEGSVGCRL